MSDEERDFVSSFEGLSEDAQCLFVRITTRKGYCFRTDKFSYEEITNIAVASSELLDHNFLIQFKEDPDLSVEHLFRIFTKTELYAILTSEVVESIPKSILKSDLESLALDQLSEDELMEKLGAQQNVLVQGLREEWSVIRLLFFGNTYGSMSDFVIRDVGNARFQEHDEEKFSPSFNTREELVAVWNIRVLRQEFGALMEEGSPEEVFEWFLLQNIKYYLSIERSSIGTQKLVHKVGYYLEREKLLGEALEVYAYTKASPSRERQVRVYKKLKELEKATVIAQEMLESPQDAKEQYFALDFLSKTEKSVKSTTKRQKAGVVVRVPFEFKNRVEQGAVEHFLSQGKQAIHSENFLWKGLFGLVLWEIIFDPEHDSIHQPLQRRPSDLGNRDFYIRRQDKIELFLDNHKTKQQLWINIENNFNRYNGIANPFVSWYGELILYLEALVKHLTLKQLKSVINTIAIDPSIRSSGFPDLFVWDDKDYYFYEVKSPTDHLSEKQLFWLEHFDSIKVKAEIALIEWGK